ncbi:MAG: hypothetical protein HKO59_01085 [Phycisphaerales bacterium]|nr:general secretion pathway protein GspB [Phycisphaerae bacterium]NNF41623.1 hypothetical protein [Phycisphaerales bacterium]NNM24573.1 hypothetical protein [Phycisphaerales bacterium]
MSSRRSSRGHTRAKASRQRKVAGLVMLTTVCAVIWGRNIWLDAPRDAKASVDVLDAPANEDAEPAGSAARRAGRPVTLTLGDGADRDPFVLDVAAYEHREVAPEPETPIVEPEAIDYGPELRTLRLQGTFLGSDPRALINNRIFVIGDTIRGFRVEAIAKRQVTLVKDGVRFDLEMERSREP